MSRLVCLAGSLALMQAVAAPAEARERLSFFGTPGLVDMPSAGRMADGNLALTVAGYGPLFRSTLAFQISPRITGAFRYAGFPEEGTGPSTNYPRYDRSFDLHFQLREEEGYWPAIAVGLRDFGGTGVYSSEYLVASKHITPRLRFTLGLGWGRLATRGGFDNPLGALDERFDSRPALGTATGEFSADQWFRGDAALFGGIEWAASDRLTLVAEYSSDDYRREIPEAFDPQASPWNFGASYQFANGVDLSAYYMYGNEIAVSLSYVIDPNAPRGNGGQETAPPALLPREVVAAQSWALPGRAAGEAVAGPAQVLQGRLADQGLRLVSYRRAGDVAHVQIENRRFGVSAQAAGRTARVMANTLPPDIARFDIALLEHGVGQSRLEIARSDLEELENDLEGGWHLLARSRIRDAADLDRSGELPSAYPAFAWDITPYASYSLFDPDNPLRYEAGAQLGMSYTPRPGLVFSGLLRQPVVNTIGDATRRSDSVLPHVRSDSVLYSQGNHARLDYLTAEYFFRPGEDLFGRVTLGYLETMFGGISSELLWAPQGSRLALGVEINHATQRDYDQGFGFQDYDVWTGHASAYYDLGKGYHGQLDVGRYLAGDWGATFTLSRAFNNGFTLGAFATITEVSTEEFGEGSFDKGIFFEIPMEWVTGQPSRRRLGQTLRPVLRDGGARLNVRNRLYEVTAPYRDRGLEAGWGKFLR